VFLSEHVLVLAANPGRVKKLVSIDLPKERDLGIRESEPFVRLAARLRTVLGS
jgi:NitT/TauT family transport system ATP-binding protein